MKTIAIFLLCYFGSSTIRAQYRKLPLDANHYWQEKNGRVGAPQDFVNCSYVLRVTKDSLINGKVFKCVDVYNGVCDSYYYLNGVGGIIREDTVRRIVTFLQGNQEMILYNFNKNVGDTVYMHLIGGMGTTTVTGKDSVLLNDGFYHRRFGFFPGTTAIEGVGGIGGLFNIWTQSGEAYTKLLCVGQISPPQSIYSSQGLGSSCPNTTGIPSFTKDRRELSMYPNPASDMIRISILSNEPLQISLCNSYGEVVLQQSAFSGMTKLDLNPFPVGLYTVIVREGINLQSKKLLILR